MHTDAFAYKSMQEVQIMKIKIKKIIKIGTILIIKKEKRKRNPFSTQNCGKPVESCVQNFRICGKY